MPMQIRRTVTVDNPPTGLVEGQLAVEMANVPPRLWVGVPTSINPAAVVQLNDFATQAWVTSQIGSYLPLAGGTLNTVTSTGGGIAMTVNDSSWSNAGIRLTSVDGYGISLNGTGSGMPLYVSGSVGRLAQFFDTRSTAITTFNGSEATVGILRGSTTNPNLFINQSSSLGAGIHITHTIAPASVGTAIRIDRGSVTNSANIYLGNIVFSSNYLSGNNPRIDGAEIRATSTAPWSATSAGTRLDFLTAPATAPVTPVVRMTIGADGAVTIPDLVNSQYLPLAGGNVTGATTINVTGTTVSGLTISSGVITAAGRALSVTNTGSGGVISTFQTTHTGGRTTGAAFNIMDSAASAATIPAVQFSRMSATGNGAVLALLHNASLTGNGLNITLPAASTGMHIQLTGGATGLISHATSVTIPNLQGYLPLMGGTLTGNLNISTASGTARIISGQTSGTNRWQFMLGDATAESTGNAGSNFAISRYDDAGTLLDSPFTITRATGAVIIQSSGYVTGKLNVGTSLAAGDLALEVARDAYIRGDLQLIGTADFQSSLYVAGELVTFGDPDSGGPGYRCLRVPN